MSRLSQPGFRKTLIWLFFIIATLSLIYSSHLLIIKDRQCIITHEENLDFLNNKTTSIHLDDKKQEREEERDSLQPILLPQRSQSYNTELKHIVFGIAASANLWEKRKEYVKIWWRPRETRGIVWMDRRVRSRRNDGLPEIRVSADTSRFKYSNRQGHRSAIRISRVVSETLRLGLKDVRWFVMGDDDTVFIVENVVRILSKYDHRQFYYVGSSSESHLQNIYFSYAMAYGGGGFAISYPLAQQLAKMQDKCIQRYPGLYGSDDRIQACMSELGVPLTKEPGFHQYDVYGDLLGLLGAHPVTPLASLHHLDVVQPVFPRMTRVKALQHLFQSVRLDSGSIMQQSICYDKKRYWSISVSWGFVVQIWRGVISPRELETPTRTFLNWYRKADYTAYAFNTRPVTKHPCLKPFIFYMSATKYDRAKKHIVSVYNRHKSRAPYCRWRMASPEKINSVVVLKRPDILRWQRSPRRDCSRVLPSNRSSTLYLWVGDCREGEISEL
ncbi:uncharacterized protein LOC8271706 [Ricinus communis]|uniref:Transferase, transferring glycosyl groups, putative n=1 Tax=Ricinus communis TaxID=3988 RepID=B9T0R4_RICCO|nr:uncharacterized protein LOC8271706 [Ricinus communis]EEF30553.1 transferase, transferring glycosyl groups, putative [Ricinus communis]|eukprot:XP_002531833.1 uncharacterized protein LOC8271706 [Ricinus communis]